MKTKAMQTRRTNTGAASKIQSQTTSQAQPPQAPVESQTETAAILADIIREMDAAIEEAET